MSKVGKIVMYNTNKNDRYTMECQHGCEVADKLPAVVLEDHGKTLSVQVFTKGGNNLFVPDVKEGSAEGEWCECGSEPANDSPEDYKGWKTAELEAELTKREIDFSTAKNNADRTALLIENDKAK